MFKKSLILFIIAFMIIGGLLITSLLFNPENTPSDSSSLDSSNASSDNTNTHDSDVTDTENSQEYSDEESLAPSEESSQIPADSVVSFIACPDNIIHPSVYYDAIQRAAKNNNTSPSYSDLHNAVYDFDPIYKNVASMIKSADLAYINVETLIGGTDKPVFGYPSFNTPAAAGHKLINLGFDIYNLAHNHMLDSYNDTFLKNCNKFFSEMGYTTIGYYSNEADTSNIKVIEKNGIKIAFLSYTYGTNGINLPAGSSTYLPLFNEQLITKQVALAKEQADLIIVSAHWGNEDTYTPTSHQKQYAQLFADLNVDVVIGMHPHVIQPMKWVDRTDGGKMLLTYSLGNFISGMQDGFNMLGGILEFNIVKSASDGSITIENVYFNPIVTHYIYNTKVKSDDTGHRNYEIFFVEDYTEEFAAVHGVNTWDKTHKPTLVGGVFTKNNLIKTVKEYIPLEFLSDYYK